MRKKIITFILVWAIVLGAGAFAFYMFKKKQQTKKESVVMNVIVHEKGVSRTLDGKPVSRGLDGIYAKDDLSFYNKTKILQRSAPEVIQELNQIGLNRQELITSIASLLALIDDQMRAKNIATDYIASLGFQLTGDEYVKLLGASKINDEFYYSNVIKNTIAHVTLPLTTQQLEAVLAPLKSGDYRSRCKTILERETIKQSGEPQAQ